MENVEALAGLYRRRGILLDTGPLVVLYVGLFDPDQVLRFPHTRQIGNAEELFTGRDFETILGFVRGFDRLITTPHVLAEVSNFLGRLSGHAKEECFAIFARHLAEATTEEHRPAAKVLAGKQEFVPFGITDSAIAEVAAGEYLVLTTDARLNAHLVNKGVASLNYNNYRPL